MRGRSAHAVEEMLGEGSEGELNLVPYLDIIMNLVIFLIFSFQVIIEMRLVDIIPPAVGASSSPSNPQDKPKAVITLAIHKGGYTVNSTDMLMGVIDVPKKDGEYDTEKLHSEMVRWKEAYQLGTSLIVMADLDTEYHHIIRLMDTVRMDGDRLLFPDVQLAKMAGGK